MTDRDIKGNAPTRVFISYSRRDRAFVSRIVDALEAQADIEVFRDTDDILPTEEWKERLEDLIGQADTVVFALSPHSAVSDVCGWEVEHALSLNKRIAPIVIKEVEPDQVPEALARYNYIFFTNKREFDASIGNLITALNTDIGWIREHTRLGEAARRWAAQGGGRTQLLRGDDLAQAERWLAERPANAPLPDADHHAFIAASRAAATRRQRFWITGSAAAVVVMGVVALFAVQQRNAAVDNARLAERNAAVAEENERAASAERDRAVAAETLAERRAESERRAKEQAERALAAATETASSMIARLAVEFRDAGVPVATVNGILEAARNLLDTLAEEGATEPELRAAMAAAHHEMAETLVRQGEAAGGRASAQRAVEILRGLVEEYPDGKGKRFNLAEALTRLSDALYRLGDFDAGAAAVGEAYDIVQALLQGEPENAVFLGGLTIVLERQAAIALATQRVADGLAILREAEAASRKALAIDPATARYRSALATVMLLIAEFSEMHGDESASLRAYEEGIQLFRELVAEDPTNTRLLRQLGSTLVAFARLKGRTVNIAAARPHYAEALEIHEKLAAADPDDDELRLMLSDIHRGLASDAQARGAVDLALRHAQQALELTAALASSNPENFLIVFHHAESHAVMGSILRADGRLARALEHQSARLDILLRMDRTMTGAALFDKDLAKAHAELGDLQVEIGDIDAAVEQLQAARDLYAAADHAGLTAELAQGRIAGLHHRMAEAYRAGDRVQESLEHYRAALEIADALVDADAEDPFRRTNQAVYAAGVGDLLSSLGDHDGAIEAYGHAAAAAEALVAFRPDEAGYADYAGDMYGALGRSLERNADAAAALTAYEAEASHRANALAADASNVDRLKAHLGALERLVDLYASAQDGQQVIGALARMNTALSALVDLEPAATDRRHYLLRVRRELADRLRETGDAEAALEVYEKIILLARDPEWTRRLREGLREPVAAASHAAGRLLAEAGDLDRGAEYQRRGLSLRAELLHDRPDEQSMIEALAESLAGVAWIHKARSEPLDALAAAQAGARLLRPLVETDRLELEGQLRYVWLLGATGELQLGLGDPLAAARAYGESVVLQKSMVDQHPDILVLRSMLGDDLARAASAHRVAGQLGQAVTAYKASIETLISANSTGRPDLGSMSLLAQTFMDLGDTLVQAGEAREALESFRHSRDVREALVKAVPGDVAQVHGLALIYWRLASNGDAPRENWQAVVDIYDVLVEQGHLGASGEAWLALARQHLAEAVAAQEGE